MSDDIIFSYSAEDAMREGNLVEVDKEMAKEAGFKWPVRITKGVLDLVTPSKEAQNYGQDFNGRLWDVLWMAFFAIKVGGSAVMDMVEFKVLFQDGPNKQYEKTLWACMDLTSGEAIHIILPGEY